MALWGLYLAPMPAERLSFRRACWRYGAMLGFFMLSLLVVAAVPWRAVQAFPQEDRQHPFDKEYGLEVLRYEFPPLPRTRLDRVFDRLAIFANLRATEVDEDQEPRDWHGERD